MKRKVRIYKDPNGKGGYMNKTAQWLRKADEGIQTGVSPVTAGIMQQMQSGQPQQTVQNSQQISNEQITQAVVALAQKGFGESEITDYLLTNAYGFTKNSREYIQYEPQVLDFVSAVFEKSEPEVEETDTTTNEPVTDFTEDVSYTDTTEEDNANDQLINDIIFDDEAKYGGVPNKRSYVNKLIRKLKKAAEGDQVEEASTANVRGTEIDPMSPPGNKNSFIAGVKGQAENHFLKQQAEELYNNQYNMDHAQFGGWRMRRANRKLFGTPNLPSNVTSSKYTFGPLGGVRTAEVQFNPLMMASMFPMYTFPGMGGYNESTRKTTKGRLVTEKIASTVNNKSTEDVANATDSDAAKTSAEGKTEKVTSTNADGTVTVDTGGGNANTTPKPETEKKHPFPIDGARQAMEYRNKRDKWGRPMSDKWYGYDPKLKKFTTGPKSKSRWSNVTYKKDQWGRSEDSKWYGYDSKKKKFVAGPYKGKNVEDAMEYRQEELDAQEGTKRLLEHAAYKNSPESREWGNIASDMFLGTHRDPSQMGGIGFGDDEPINYLMPTGSIAAAEPIAFQFTSGAKGLLGQGAKGALNPGQRLLNPGQKLLNPGQRLLEAPGGTQFVMPFAAGGFVNNPMQDQFGNLQKFIYGDQVDDDLLESLYQPPINQSDLDYTDSKDVTDAYFRDGGLYTFDGEDDSQIGPSNTPKTYTQEEIDKIIADRQKTWETDNQTKIQQQQQQQMQQQMQQYQAMQQYMNPNSYGSYNYGYRGAPMGGFGGYGGPGLIGAAGRLAGSFMGGRQSQFSPVGNPLQYAATAAGITKAGMLPTGMKYAKERKQDGNWFEKNLGFNKDRIWTIDYATPEQIKAGAKPGTTTPAVTSIPGTDQNKSFRDRRLARRDERLNRGIPDEAPITTTPTSASSTSNYTKFNPYQVNPIMAGQGIPQSNLDAVTGNPGVKVQLQDGGYIPDYMAYDGYLPQAGPGIDVSSVSFAGNPVVGLEPSSVWSDMTSFGTNQNIKNPEAGKFKTYTVEPDDLKDCTYEQKLDSTSKCYDPQTAQLKIKEEREGLTAQRAANISGGIMDFGNLLADDMSYANEYRTKEIPGKTEFARGERQSANQGINRGMWKSYSGEEGDPKGFKGVMKKGGAIKSKKSIASGHKIDMNDFQSLLKLAGLI